jgi:hypothetical protein
MSMSGTSEGIHVNSFLGLGGFLLVWIILFECAHLLVAMMRDDPPIAWAIGPLGLTTLFVYEPTALYIVLDALLPALVSGSVLYIGLFTSLASPIAIPRHLLIEIIVVAVGVLITSTRDFVITLRDLRYPLWGEARILRSIQILHASWATIHFTAFGLSYLRDHFGNTPTDILQVV